ncbi:MAG: DUF3098 domain-containing protein [Chitinophagaceae bacterium]
MIERKPVLRSNIPLPKITVPASNDAFSFFNKSNYIWMVAGLVVIAIGMMLMSGGKSPNPAVFDQKEVYSTTRITIAPILIVIGLALEVVGIFKNKA